MTLTDSNMTCSATDIIGTSPPLNVQATQSSSSAPVEVSWSPPSVADGANIITGYRIYYGNRENVFVQSVTAITLVGLNVDGDYVGRGVSIRSESDQLYSERISVPITIGKWDLFILHAVVIFLAFAIDQYDIRYIQLQITKQV